MIRLTQDAYLELCEENGGFCLACHAEAFGIEPDAREYQCEDCGAAKVYGAEELLLMGEITFTEGARA